MKSLGWVTGVGLALGVVARAQDTNTTATTTTTPPEHNGRAHHGHMEAGGLGQGGTEQYRAEMEKFRESLKDMPEDQRQEAIKKFREKMGAKMKTGAQDRAAKFKEHIEQNPNLTAEQKKEILEHMEKTREKFRVEYQKIMGDSSLNAEQKRAAMKKFREEMEVQGKTMREKYRGVFGPKSEKSGSPQEQPSSTPPSV